MGDKKPPKVFPKEPDPDGPWQKVYDSLLEHPKLLSTAHQLGTPENMIGFGLIRLWKAARDEKNHGVLRGWRPDQVVAAMRLTSVLSDGVEATDVVQVLIDQRLLDLVDGEYRIHNWDFGQRTGAKIEELSRRGSHGNHVRYDHYWPGSCDRCGSHVDHIDGGEIADGCHVCEMELRGEIPTKGENDVRDLLSPEQGSPDQGSQKGETSPEQGSHSGIADIDQDLDGDHTDFNEEVPFT